MSICTKLAGKIHRADFAAFDKLAADPDMGVLLGAAPRVLQVLTVLASHGAQAEPAPQKTASASPARFDVVQLRRDGDFGYLLKVSAAPSDVAPQEKKVTPFEAKKAVPAPMVEEANQQGVSTATNVQADPDPFLETPAPITSFGLYKVFEATGKQLMGFVVPGLFDPVVGDLTPLQLFTSGGQYALQEEPFSGVMVGVSFNLPEAPMIRGLGVFYKGSAQALMATVPYTVLGEVTLPTGKFYAAQDMNGADVQIAMSEGLKRPVAAGPGEVILPHDFKWLPLDNPIDLATPTAVGAQKMAAAEASTLKIRAWRGGPYELTGPVVEKIGSGTYDRADALFWMAAAGIPQESGVAILKTAERRGVMSVAGLKALSPPPVAAAKEASTLPPLPKACLLAEVVAMIKEGSGRGIDTQTVDTLLSLNFLTPENVQIFTEGIPQLEETAGKLAELSLAADLGLDTSVPATAVNRAMSSLEDVIQSLKALVEHQV